MIVSSANCKWEIILELSCVWTPSIKPISEALSIIIWITSPTILNRKGERGSPFLSPLEKVNSAVGDLLIRTEAFIVLRRVWIRWHHIEPKPKDSIVSNRHCQSIESNAFSKSSYIIAPGDSFDFNVCMTSLQMRIPSEICLPLMKPVCELLIILSITLANLKVRTFVNGFKEQLIRLIGLKSDHYSASFFFGIRVMN